MIRRGAGRAAGEAAPSTSTPAGAGTRAEAAAPAPPAPAGSGGSTPLLSTARCGRPATHCSTPLAPLAPMAAAAAKAAGLAAPVGLVDAVMSAMGVPDEDAAPAVDRKGKPVTESGWKITERVPLSEDLVEHMKREVLPYAPDAIWDEGKAKHGTDIPFTKIFYMPEEPRPLSEIDSDVEKLMGELAEMFTAVSEG